MKALWNFIRTTVIGGLLFLVPLVVLIVILMQAFGLMLDIAEPLGDLFPVDNIGGVALANILVIFLLLLLCFIAGLVATRRVFTNFQDYIERKILMKIPGYGFIRGITRSFKMDNETSESFIPVFVRIADFEQMGLEIERSASGKVVVYLPGSPNAWSGTIIYTHQDKIKKIDISVTDAMGYMEQLGMGSSLFLK